MYISTKNFDNFSVALRQWKAKHSHCQLMHGYAFEIKVWFASNEEDIDKQLDDMNWIVDYGSFKKPPLGNGLRAWLDEMFDHTTLLEKDDPYLDFFKTAEIYIFYPFNQLTTCAPDFTPVNLRTSFPFSKNTTVGTETILYFSTND